MWVTAEKRPCQKLDTKSLCEWIPHSDYFYFQDSDLVTLCGSADFQLGHKKGVPESDLTQIHAPASSWVCWLPVQLLVMLPSVPGGRDGVFGVEWSSTEFLCQAEQKVYEISTELNTNYLFFYNPLFKNFFLPVLITIFTWQIYL